MLCALFGAACQPSIPLGPPAAPLTPPAVLCTDAKPAGECSPADRVEAWLRSPNLTILGSASTPAGTQGAKVLTLAVPEPGGRVILRAKWRPMSSSSFTNDPRKELGAYAVEKLFLEPHEYVAPPTVGHCFDLDHYRSLVERAAPPMFEERGVRCAFGILAYWLENVGEPEGVHEKGLWSSDSIFDEKLFESDRSYGKSVADLNLLAYLIRHGDAHVHQFLITKDRSSPRVYTVDNSIAFQSIKNPMVFFREDWSGIRVPAVSRRSIDRLRHLTDADWARLSVIEQYQKVGDRLVPVQPESLIGQPGDGERWVGIGLQIGLTDAEIQGVRNRLKSLVAQVDSGDLRTF